MWSSSNWWNRATASAPPAAAVVASSQVRPPSSPAARSESDSGSESGRWSVLSSASPSPSLGPSNSLLRAPELVARPVDASFRAALQRGLAGSAGAAAACSAASTFAAATFAAAASFVAPSAVAPPSPLCLSRGWSTCSGDDNLLSVAASSVFESDFEEESERNDNSERDVGNSISPDLAVIEDDEDACTCALSIDGEPCASCLDLYVADHGGNDTDIGFYEEPWSMRWAADTVLKLSSGQREGCLAFDGSEWSSGVRRGDQCVRQRFRKRGILTQFRAPAHDYYSGHHSREDFTHLMPPKPKYADAKANAILTSSSSVAKQQQVYQRGLMRMRWAARKCGRCGRGSSSSCTCRMGTPRPADVHPSLPYERKGGRWVVSDATATTAAEEEEEAAAPPQTTTKKNAIESARTARRARLAAIASNSERRRLPGGGRRSSSSAPSSSSTTSTLPRSTRPASWANSVRVLPATSTSKASSASAIEAQYRELALRSFLRGQIKLTKTRTRRYGPSFTPESVVAMDSEVPLDHKRAFLGALHECERRRRANGEARLEDKHVRLMFVEAQKLPSSLIQPSSRDTSASVVPPRRKWSKYRCDPAGTAGSVLATRDAFPYGGARDGHGAAAVERVACLVIDAPPRPPPPPPPPPRSPPPPPPSIVPAPGSAAAAVGAVAAVANGATLSSSSSTLESLLRRFPPAATALPPVWVGSAVVTAKPELVLPLFRVSYSVDDGGQTGWWRMGRPSSVQQRVWRKVLYARLRRMHDQARQASRMDLSPAMPSVLVAHFGRRQRQVWEYCTGGNSWEERCDNCRDRCYCCSPPGPCLWMSPEEVAMQQRLDEAHSAAAWQSRAAGLSEERGLITPAQPMIIEAERIMHRWRAKGKRIPDLIPHIY